MRAEVSMDDPGVIVTRWCRSGCYDNLLSQKIVCNDQTPALAIKKLEAPQLIRNTSKNEVPFGTMRRSKRSVVRRYLRYLSYRGYLCYLSWVAINTLTSYFCPHFTRKGSLHMFSMFKPKQNQTSDAASGLKLNLGCGLKKIAGFVNVDKFPECEPDLVVDLEQFPWPFETNSVTEIHLIHVLEHLGAHIDTFKNIIQELYRICRNDAEIHIHVPHPRSDNFINDPTHVRIITPALLGTLDMNNCAFWEKVGASNTQLARYWGVNFQTIASSIVPEEKYLKALESGKLTQEELMDMVETRFNIVSEYQIKLKAIK